MMATSLLGTVLSLVGFNGVANAQKELNKQSILDVKV